MEEEEEEEVVLVEIPALLLRLACLLFLLRLLVVRGVLLVRLASVCLGIEREQAKQASKQEGKRTSL
jgi:hypothetical protein